MNKTKILSLLALGALGTSMSYAADNAKVDTYNDYLNQFYSHN